MTAQTIRPATEEIEERGPAAYVAEVIGTFILVFAICGAVSASATGEGFTLNLAGLGLVHAIALGVGIYTLGGTSGGHFNPAVTVGLLTVGKIRGRDAGFYIVCQLAGALIAALLVLVLFHDSGDSVNYGAPAINDAVITDGSPFIALIAEAVGTAILMWAVMGMAVNPRAETALAPLVIGLSLGVGAIIFAPATSASLNPARWFGPSVVAGQFDDFWVYILGPIIGAAVAAIGYRTLVLEERGLLPGTRPVDVLEERPGSNSEAE